MSLPAGQQRVLDGMAERLRASEPRLATMYAIFTRLSKNEAPPWREQLRTSPAVLVWLSALARRCGGRRISWRGSTGKRILIVGPMAAVFVLLGVLMGLNSGTPANCRAERFPAAIAAPHSAGCANQVAPRDAWFGK